MSAPLLSLDGLSVCYGMISALRDLSLEVAEGSIVSLIGSNGAGKTTTLNAISGVVPAAGGRIVFRGESIDRASAEARVAMGLSQVPEGRRVFPRMTVRETMQLGAFRRGSDSEIERDIEAVGRLFPVLE